VYNITASHAGFSPETRTDVTLTADQVATASFTLKLGATSAAVEVKSDAVEINTTNGAIGEVINEKSIVELPLNGRNPAELVFTVPGAVNGASISGIALPGPGSGFPLSETGASVNGSRMGQVFYMLDGVNHMDNYFQTANPFPNSDATQEFRVTTNNFDAQYGFSGGAVVSVATWDESTARQRFRIPPQQRLQRSGLFHASGRSAQAQSIWWVNRRSDSSRQTIYFREFPANNRA
jgi:hypothetical protein